MASDVIFCLWRSIKLDKCEARFLGPRDLTQNSDCIEQCIEIWTFDRHPGIFHKSINKLAVVEKGSVLNHRFTWTCSPVTLYRYSTLRFFYITFSTNIFRWWLVSIIYSGMLLLCLIVFESTKDSKSRFGVKCLDFVLPFGLLCLALNFSVGFHNNMLQWYLVPQPKCPPSINEKYVALFKVPPQLKDCTRTPRH